MSTDNTSNRRDTHESLPSGSPSNPADDLPELLKEYAIDDVDTSLRYEPGQVKLTFGERVFLFVTSPVGPLWVLAAIALIAGAIHSIVSRQIQWEAFTAAGMLCLMVRVVARFKGVPPWPWSDPSDVEHDDDDD